MAPSRPERPRRKPNSEPLFLKARLANSEVRLADPAVAVPSGGERRTQLAQGLSRGRGPDPVILADLQWVTPALGHLDGDDLVVEQRVLCCGRRPVVRHCGSA